jgi:hypothetical protein
VVCLGRSPTTQSSIAELEETEDNSALAAVLDGYGAPLAGHSTPLASSKPMNSHADEPLFLLSSKEMLR